MNEGEAKGIKVSPEMGGRVAGREEDEVRNEKRHSVQGNQMGAETERGRTEEGALAMAQRQVVSRRSRARRNKRQGRKGRK